MGKNRELLSTFIILTFDVEKSIVLAIADEKMASTM